MRVRGWWLETLLSLGLASCTPEPAAPRPAAAPVAKPAPLPPTTASQAAPLADPSPDCPKFTVTTSSWLNVIDSFKELDSTFQDDALESGSKPRTKNPCGPAVETCKDWG